MARPVGFGHAALHAVGIRFVPECPNLHREKGRLGIRRRGKNRNFHLPDPRTDQPDGLRSRVREVDHPSPDKGTAVDDPDVDRLVVRQVADSYNRLERQGTVGGHERFHVVDLAVRRSPAVVGMPVPAGQSAFH